MSGATVIPTPATPDVCTLVVLVDGDEISGEFHVLSASVTNQLNRVPSASLQLRDGEASKQTFAVSDTDHFVPGKEIELRLGYRGEVETVFKGLIVTHRVRVRHDGSLLSVECRDRAVRMTRHPQSRYYTDTTDADIVDELIGGYGLDREVAPTKPSLREVVQYDATDWDFVVCRAEANGHVVAVHDGKVTVGPPATDAEPVVTTQYGATLLELDAEIDARLQVAGIRAVAWSATDQELIATEADEPAVTAGGNLSPSDLTPVIGDEPYLLRHGGKLGETELQAWADGRLLKQRLAKVRGRARFQGFASVTAGDVVGVIGIGDRFSGPHYVAGIRHTFANGNWETDVQFGLDPEIFAATYPVTAHPAGGLLPAVNGLQTGVVTALQGDPDGEERIKVRLPLVSDAEEGVWARLSTLDAGMERGTFFRPEIDDEVVVGFLDGDPRFPVVLGTCHSSAKAAPEPARDDNHLKGYQSRSRMRLTFDDDAVAVVLETSGGNRLTLSEDTGSVSLTDQNGNAITLDDGGVTVESAKDLTLKASGDVKVEGRNLTLAAQLNLSIDGSGGVDIGSSATTTVQGSLVRIN